MEYSKINLQQGNIEIFGIWNIPAIFQKTFNKRNIEIFGIWNITGIIKKLIFHAKLSFLWGI